MAMEGVMPQKTARTEYGHKYKWHEELGFWFNVGFEAHQNPVQVFPPNGTRKDWWVVTPRVGGFHKLRGTNAEDRCFVIAASFIE